MVAARGSSVRLAREAIQQKAWKRSKAKRNKPIVEMKIFGNRQDKRKQRPPNAQREFAKALAARLEFGDDRVRVARRVVHRDGHAAGEHNVKQVAALALAEDDAIGGHLEEAEHATHLFGGENERCGWVRGCREQKNGRKLRMN